MDKTLVWMHLVTVGPLVLYKITGLWIGYLIARLGYNLLLKGVTGKFRFSADLKGNKADLVSASPGVFFIFMAVVLMAVSIIKDKPFYTEYDKTYIERKSDTPVDVPNETKPEFPNKETIQSKGQ